MDKNSEKIIGVDFDDVLHNFNDGLMAFFNARYNTTFKREQVTEYYIEKLYGKTLDEMFETFNEFCFSENHKILEPVQGAQEAIAMLASKYKLIIITARPRVLKEVTEAWLDLHFPHVFKEIHYSREQWKDSKKKNKSALAQELGVTHFIEDSLENAHDISGVNIPVYLIDAPWNQGEVPNGVTRVFHWNEIPKLIY